jgi:hypothetical protein
MRASCLVVLSVRLDLRHFENKAASSATAVAEQGTWPFLDFSNGTVWAIRRYGSEHCYSGC